MKSIRLVLLFVAVAAVASIASAQCLVCYSVPGGGGAGECDYNPVGGYCSGDCCDPYAFPGMACRIPDPVYSCWYASAKPEMGRSMILRVPRRTHPSFSNRYLLEQNATATQRRLSRCNA